MLKSALLAIITCLAAGCSTAPAPAPHPGPLRLGGYAPIPNEVNGLGCSSGNEAPCAAYKVRQDINDRLGGAVAIAPLLTTSRVSASTIAAAQSPYSITAAMGYYDCNAASGNVTLTLPPASGTFNAYAVKKIDSSANTCTVAPSGSDTIDGSAAPVVLNAQYQLVSLKDAASGSWESLSVSNAVVGLTPGRNTPAAHSIAQFSVNGKLNVRDPYFGATASTVSGTASTTASSTTVTMDAVHDFRVGDHIVIYGAGAASSLTAPTLSVAQQAYKDDGTGTITASNKSQSTGQLLGCWVDALASVPAWQPSHNYNDSGSNLEDEIAVQLDGQWYGFYHGAQTNFTSGSSIPDFKTVLHGPPNFMGTPWTNGAHVGDNGDFGWVPFGLLSNSTLANTACNVTYSYEACPVDASGGIGTCSSIQTISGTGAAVLSPSNINVLTITNPSGTVADVIGRCTGASCTPSLYTVIPVYGASTSTQTYFDIGNAQGQYLDASGGIHTANGSATTAMPTVVRQPLLTTIASCGATAAGAPCTSTSFVLAAAPGASGTFQVLHDDGPAFNSTIAAACPSTNATSAVYVPAGTYNVATPIASSNCAGLRVSGEATRGGADAGSVLSWRGGIGATIWQLWKGREQLLENLTFDASQGATPTVGVDIDNTGTGSVTPTDNQLAKDHFSFIANPVRIGNVGSANNENTTFTDLVFGNGADGGYAAVFIAGGSQTDKEMFRNILVSYGPWNYAFDLGGSESGGQAGVGSLEVHGFSSSSGRMIGVYLASTLKSITLSDWFDEGLARLYWDAGGFGAPLTVSNSYFTNGNIAPDEFFVDLGNSALTSINNEWGAAQTAPMKINLGAQAGSNRGWAGRSVSFLDHFADAAAIFTPYHGTPAGSVIAVLASTGLTDAGTSSSNNSTALRLNGPLIGGPVSGGLASTGSLVSAPVGTIPAPTVTVVGTAGSTSHSYYLVCHDANGEPSRVSAAGSTSTANATLSPTNYDAIKWNPTPGCLYYDVYKDATSGASLLMSNVSQTARGPQYEIDDMGQALSTSTAPTVDLTGLIAAGGPMRHAPVSFSNLPSSCTAASSTAGADEYDCYDCKNVADGVTMGSACVSGGTGSIAVCGGAGSPPFRCGAPG